MSHTNTTTNLKLPQFIGTDIPAWLTDVNEGYAAIDLAVHENTTAIASANDTIGSLDTRIGNNEGDISALETNANEQSADIESLKLRVVAGENAMPKTGGDFAGKVKAAVTVPTEAQIFNCVVAPAGTDPNTLQVPENTLIFIKK